MPIWNYFGQPCTHAAQRFCQNFGSTSLQKDSHKSKNVGQMHGVYILSVTLQNLSKRKKNNICGYQDTQPIHETWKMTSAFLAQRCISCPLLLEAHISNTFWISWDHSAFQWVTSFLPDRRQLSR